MENVDGNWLIEPSRWVYLRWHMVVKSYEENLRLFIHNFSIVPFGVSYIVSSGWKFQRSTFFEILRWSSIGKIDDHPYKLLPFLTRWLGLGLCFRPYRGSLSLTYIENKTLNSSLYQKKGVGYSRVWYISRYFPMALSWRTFN